VDCVDPALGDWQLISYIAGISMDTVYGENSEPHPSEEFCARLPEGDGFPTSFEVRFTPLRFFVVKRNRAWTSRYVKT